VTRHPAMKSRKLAIESSIGLLWVVGFINAAISPACSQVLVDVPLRDFSDRNSVPLVCGKVVSFTDQAIQVQDGLKITHILPMRGLSRSDQKFIIDLFNQIESESSKTQLKSLQRIAQIGPVATSLSEDIATLAIESSDGKVAAAALVTFTSICPRDTSSTKTILEILNARPDVLAIIEQNPTTFFDSLARIGPYAEPILNTAAFTGEMRFDLKKKPKTPTALPTVKGKKNSIRAAACFALSHIKTASSRASVLLVLQSAETPINDQIDLFTVSQIYMGSAKGGQVISSAWEASLKRNEKRLPREAATWRETSKVSMKASINKSRLLVLSRLKRFFDRQGNYMLRGTLQSFSDGLVLISDENKKRVAIEIEKFSVEDKKWIQEKTKQK